MDIFKCVCRDTALRDLVISTGNSLLINVDASGFPIGSLTHIQYTWNFENSSVVLQTYRALPIHSVHLPLIPVSYRLPHFIRRQTCRDVAGSHASRKVTIWFEGLRHYYFTLFWKWIWSQRQGLESACAKCFQQDGVTSQCNAWNHNFTRMICGDRVIPRNGPVSSPPSLYDLTSLY